MAYNPSQPRHPRGAPVGGQWAPDNRRAGATAVVSPRPLRLREDWDELTPQQKQDDVRQYVLDALHEHGLDDWSFRIGKGRKLFGSASYRTKTISVSKYAIEHSQEQAKDTAMHEVAHAIAGPTARHNEQWRAIAQALGSNGKAKHNVVIEKPKTTVMRRWRDGIVHFEEGVTEFELTGRKFTVQEVHRKNLIASENSTGKRYRVSIDRVASAMKNQELSAARDELQAAVDKLGAKKGRDYALRAAHGLETGPEAMALQGRKASKDTLQAMLFGGSPMPSYNGDHERSAGSVVAKHDLSGAFEPLQSVEGHALRRVAIFPDKSQPAIHMLVPASAATSLAGLLSASQRAVDEMESVGWEYDTWAAQRTNPTFTQFLTQKRWADAAKAKLGTYLKQL